MNRKLALGIIASAITLLPAQGQQQYMQTQPPADTSFAPQQAYNAPPTGYGVERLGDIRKIFVAPLGYDQGSELIRQKLIDRIVKSGVVAVLNTPDGADAVLTGVTSMNHKNDLSSVPLPSFMKGNGHYSADSVVRLIGRNNQLLWTDESTAGKFPGPSRSMRGVSSSAADRMAKSLIDAIVNDRRKRGM